MPMGKRSNRLSTVPGGMLLFPHPISFADALVGGDDRVRAAHRKAVGVALNELERYTQARMGGNRPAEATGEFIVAKFEHDTARPVDGYAAPQLHTHAVIFNVTERADGTTARPPGAWVFRVAAVRHPPFINQS